MEDEIGGAAIEKFAGLKFLVKDNIEHKRGKGVNKNVGEK